jgi:hypothetical protein
MGIAPALVVTYLAQRQPVVQDEMAHGKCAARFLSAPVPILRMRVRLGWGTAFRSLVCSTREAAAEIIRGVAAPIDAPLLQSWISPDLPTLCSARDFAFLRRR